MINDQTGNLNKGVDRREIFSSHLCDFVYILTVVALLRNVKLLSE